MSAALKMVQSYLSNGGLFNPELMPHDKVRDMVIACRDELEAKVQECERLKTAITSPDRSTANGVPGLIPASPLLQEKPSE